MPKISGLDKVRLRRLPNALIGCVWFSLVLAGSADAGTYKLYSCNVPGRETPVPSTAPWTATLDGLNTNFFDNCVNGGGFGIGLNQGQRFMRPGTSAGLALIRPSTGAKAAIGIVRYRTWITADLAGSGAPAFISDGGAYSPPGGSGIWTSPVYSETNKAVYVQLYCSTGGEASDCHFESAVPLRVDAVEADLYEDVAPTGTIDSGTLVEPGPHSGQATLDFTAVDQESGVSRVEALLGETVVATADLERNGRLCPHTDLNACVSRHTGQLVIDTARVPTGEYVVTLRITDAAGNQRLVSGPRRTVSVTNGSSLQTPTRGAHLTAQFGNSRATYTSNFGRSARVRGRLRDPSGRGIGGARLEIIEKSDAAGVKEVLSSTTTRNDGAFSFIVSGTKPSRSIVVRYVKQAGDASSASRRLRLRIRAASTFALTLHGITVRYKGRILTRPIPRGGTQIYIQGRASGGAWQRFAVRRTDSRGRFAGRYRLRVRRPGIRLQFRFEIPKQKRYAFAPRIGSVIARTVR